VATDTITRLTDRATYWLSARGRSIGEWWMPKGDLRRIVPRVAAVALAVIYFAIFYRLVWLRHDRFGTFDYDLGMYDQGIWLLSKGSGFMTVRGMQVFGHHANLGFLLFVPAYWLGAGPHFLNFMNTLGVVACVLPIYLLGRHHLRSDWAGFWLSAAYLFHYVPQWMIQETFHPENLAAPFIFGAFWFATTKRWKPYWWCIALALIWKEDVALVVAMMGVLVFFMFGDRRRGVWTLAVGAGWFVVATKGIIPYFSPDGAVFDGLFGALGNSATDVVITSITHPTLAGEALAEHGADKGALQMMRPFAFAAIPSPHVLLLGLPQHLVNFLSAQSFTWNTTAHYAMFPFVAVTLASIRTVATRSRKWVQWGVIAAMLCGVALTADQGAGPWSANYTSEVWAYNDTAQNRAVREMIRKIPGDAAVSADYYIVPHLAHRREIYTFPNPWISSNFGVNGRPTRSPGRVDYVIANKDPMTGDVRDTFDQLLEGSEFTIVDRSDDLYLLKRVNG